MSDGDDPRLVPLHESEWAPRLGAVRAGLDPVLNIHRVLARHPDLLAAWAPLRHHVAAGGTLSARHREFVILRLAHRAGSAYEWHHHAIRARQAGLTPGEIEAIRSGEAGSDDEETLLVATDELFDDLSISDPTWRELAAAFSTEQVLDLVVTVGVYVTLVMVIGAARIPIET